MIYNVQFGPLPYILELPEEMPLAFSKHAVAASMSDRYGFVRLEASFSTLGAEVVEIETATDTDWPIKAVIRRSHDHLHDICLVVLLEPESNGKYFVKTLWLNEKRDKHRTLKRERYQHVS